MATNKRMVLDALSTFRQEETAIPQSPKGGLVVKVTHAGICFSDVHMAHTPKFHPAFVFPRVLGHEIAGTLYSMSEEAQKERPDLAIGDNVLVFPWGNCMNCNFCRNDCSFCATMAYGAGPVGAYNYGVWRDGGYQNYVVVEVPSFLEKVPANIPMNQACLIPCSGLTAYNGVSAIRESVERAQRVNGVAQVGVVGAGGLGLWAIQLIKALYGPKVKVVAVDIQEQKLADAKAFGADRVHKWLPDDKAEQAVQSMVSACQGRMDAVVDFIGGPSFMKSLLSLNIGGTLCIVGLTGDKFPETPVNAIVRRNVTVRGSMVGTLNQLRQLIQIVKDGKVLAPPVEEVRLEDVPDTMQKLLKGQQRGRAVVKM